MKVTEEMELSGIVAIVAALAFLVGLAIGQRLATEDLRGRIAAEEVLPWSD